MSTISSPPPPVDGIHTWIMGYAWHCRKTGMSSIDAVNAINAFDGSLRRRLQPREAQDAVEKAYRAKLDPSVKFERKPELPAWSSKETARIYTANPITPQDMTSISPEADPASFHPHDILHRLFPDPGGLLCVGESAYRFKTAPLADHRHLRLKQFITPAYMSAVYGLTHEGRKSMHCKANTGDRRFIVCDFDSPPPEQHPAIIMHLNKFRPLVLVLTSGGKGLHAWFPTTSSASDDSLFWRLCITLGADPALYRNHSQFVRMPNGTRDNGKRQSVVYLNFKPTTNQ